MQDDPPVWLVNITDKPIQKVILELHKVFDFLPNRPLVLPRSIALQQMDTCVKICDNPSHYFLNNAMRRLIIRDGGIGDILLLEPCLRAMLEQQQKITLATMQTTVLENNPAVDSVIQMANKNDIQKIKRDGFDCVDDLRDYSETCENREKKHRTDCYNQIFNADIKDAEPRIYFSDVEKKVFLKKEEGYKYIGVSFDASHKFRKYEKGKELINKVLESNKNNIVVLMGSYDFCLSEKNKRVLDYQGKTTVREMFRLVRDLDALIAVDSGIMHVGLTLHVPTVCIFSIIFPHLRGVMAEDTKDEHKRMCYYKGPYVTIFPKNDMPCRGCGSLHMAECKEIGKNATDNVIPKCMNINPEVIIDKLNSLPMTTERRVFHNDHKEIIQQAPAQIHSKAKLTMPIIVLNEEKNLPRFIELVMSHPSIGRVIAIDGGSTDKTVELLEKAGAEVYIHPYDKNHPNMQAIQREYSTYFLGENDNIIIFDIDEYMSKELWNYLPYLAECKDGFIQLSRRTFDKYEDSLHLEKQILNFPDWQPRVFCSWNHKYKWFRSPHHIVLNTPLPKNIDKAIIHCQGEGKNREQLEKQWGNMYLLSKRQYGF